MRQAVRVLGYIVLGAAMFSIAGAAGARLRIEFSRDLQAFVLVLALLLYSVTGWLTWKVLSRIVPRAHGAVPEPGGIRMFVVSARSYKEAIAIAEVEAQQAGLVAPRVDNWESAEGLAEGTPWTDGSRRQVRVYVAEDRPGT